ncbi:MAG: DUF370 domain-containing protein [Eubacteriales bacterium]|nr:DUF370 domain-containing protein [Eubacteriales bacterium]
MYIHIGGEYSVSSRLIVGIFDFEETTQEGSQTRAFLKNAQDTDKIELVSSDLPRSFVVTVERVYLSPISAATLRKRIANQNDPTALFHENRSIRMVNP